MSKGLPDLRDQWAPRARLDLPDQQDQWARPELPVQPARQDPPDLLARRDRLLLVRRSFGFARRRTTRLGVVERRPTSMYSTEARRRQPSQSTYLIRMA